MPIVNLSPPWETYASKIRYTYGLSEYIQVNNLVQTGDSYTLVINVCNDDIAQALRQVLPTVVEFGNVNMNIIIFNSEFEGVDVQPIEYTPETLAETFCRALYSNPLFVGAVLTEGKIPEPIVGPIGDVVLVIAPCVVQFFDDIINDLCGNYNEVASNVFNEITILEYNPGLTISFSTYDPKCAFQKDLYCSNSWCHR